MLSGLRNFALTFLISAVVFGLLAWGIVSIVVGTLEDTIPTGDTSSVTDIIPGVSDTEPDDTSSDVGSTGPEDGTDEPLEELVGETFNILLVGTDYQPELFDDYDYEQKWDGPGFPDRRNREWGADMLILLRVDKEDRQFMFCPIPRNTRVLVDGTYVQLGDVLALENKGIDYLCGMVSSLTGLSVDYYARVDVGSIAAAIDIVGTIEYEIPEDMFYSDPMQDLEIDLSAGRKVLNGATAAQLLRYVGYENGPVQRMKVTVDLCNAFLEKFTAVKYIDKADDLYNALEPYIVTNFSLDDLLNNLDLIFSYSKFNSVTETYPGYNKIYDGVTYFEPALNSALKKFAQYR